MIVYRCVSEREIAKMIGISTFICSPHGENTFKYKKNINYKHFYYYYDSAVQFMKIQNSYRYYDKLSIIMAYDIKDEILNEYFGLGTYRLSYVPKNLKDSILEYFDIIYYPEFAIPESLIKKDMIVGIGNDKRITPVSYIYYDILEETITESQKSFLNYEKWLFENGINVFKEIILEERKTLFPINNINKNL